MKSFLRRSTSLASSGSADAPTPRQASASPASSASLAGALDERTRGDRFLDHPSESLAEPGRRPAGLAREFDAFEAVLRWMGKNAAERAARDLAAGVSILEGRAAFRRQGAVDMEIKHYTRIYTRLWLALAGVDDDGVIN